MSVDQVDRKQEEERSGRTKRNSSRQYFKEKNPSFEESVGEGIVETGRRERSSREKEASRQMKNLRN